MRRTEKGSRPTLFIQFHDSPLSPQSLQYESADKTSPAFRVARPRQVKRLIESLTHWTWPSQQRTFTPPEWLARAVLMAGLWGGEDCQQSGVFEFGAR